MADEIQGATEEGQQEQNDPAPAAESAPVALSDLVDCYRCKGKGTFKKRVCTRCHGERKTPRTTRGAKPGEYRGGRSTGTKNKRTITREMVIEALKSPDFKEVIGEVLQDGPLKPETPARRKAIDILSEFLPAVLMHAVRYHNQLVELIKGGAQQKLIDEIEAKLIRATDLLYMAGGRVAPYESPRFSAVLVGAAVVNRITVEGGMPEDFVAPAVGNVTPGTIVEAESDLVTVTSSPPTPTA